MINNSSLLLMIMIMKVMHKMEENNLKYKYKTNNSLLLLKIIIIKILKILKIEKKNNIIKIKIKINEIDQN